MLAPGVLAEPKGTNLTAHGVVGEEKDAELVRLLRGNWEGKDAAVRKVIQEWNHFPLRRIQYRGEFSISFGPRYYASVSFEGAPDSVDLSFIPDRTGGTNGPLMIDTLRHEKDHEVLGLAADLKSDRPGGEVVVRNSLASDAQGSFSILSSYNESGFDDAGHYQHPIGLGGHIYFGRKVIDYDQLHASNGRMNARMVKRNVAIT